MWEQLENKYNIIVEEHGYEESNKFFYKYYDGRHIVKHIDINDAWFIDKSKLFTLYDPIISSKEIMIKVNNSKKDKSELKNTFLSIGRLTKQKNFSFLISNFKKFNDKKNYNLLIVGEGEDYKKLNKLIKKQKLSKSIKIIGYQSNVYNYLKNCKCFIMPSLWEDPGFVLVEAAYAAIPIISSNCMSGPKEILNYGKNGIIFETNNSQDFIEKMIKAIKFLEVGG